MPPVIKSLISVDTPPVERTRDEIIAWIDRQLLADPKALSQKPAHIALVRTEFHLQEKDDSTVRAWIRSRKDRLAKLNNPPPEAKPDLAAQLPDADLNVKVAEKNADSIAQNMEVVQQQLREALERLTEHHSAANVKVAQELAEKQDELAVANRQLEAQVNELVDLRSKLADAIRG